MAKTEVSGLVTDLAALKETSMAAAWVWPACAMSLAGLPPAVGFLGKASLFWWCIANQQLFLLSVGIVSSAISMVYYLKLMRVALLGSKTSTVVACAIRSDMAYVLSLSLCLILGGLWYSSPLFLVVHAATLPIGAFG